MAKTSDSKGSNKHAQYLERSQDLLVRLNNKLQQYIVDSKISLGDAEVTISNKSTLDFFRLLKLDSELAFNLLVSVTAIDWMDQKDERFEVVYHLLSLSKLNRLRIKIPVSEREPVVESITSLYDGANFMESEVYDMYGINFKGHPNQRRILMYDEFVGHPLRKDYPVQGKQPRIKLRSPEVINTATLMKRPELVQIGKS